MSLLITRPVASLHETAKRRPPHYLERVYALGTVFEDAVQFTPENYLLLVEEFSPALLEKVRETIANVRVSSAVPREQWPVWAKVLAAAAREGDRGVGDVVHRTIGEVNSKRFKAWYRGVFGKDCGCAGRREEWNRRYQF